MSSTTSPQIPSNRGRCVVCGEESHLRCSECAKHGTDWMFFCSEKHQMLVHSIHRKVCGVRSSPFEWPGLSAAERNLVEDIFANNPKDEHHEKMEEFYSHFADAPKDQRMSMTTDSQSIINIRQVICTLALARWTSYEEVVTEDSPVVRCSFKFPFAFAIDLQEAIVPGLASNGGGYGHWWTEFQHKLMIQVAIRQQYLRDRNNGDLAKCLHNTQTELGEIITKKIALTHPEEANRMLDVFSGKVRAE